MVGQMTRQRNLLHSLRRHARERSCTQALVPVLSESRALESTKQKKGFPALCFVVTAPTASLPSTFPGDAVRTRFQKSV